MKKIIIVLLCLSSLLCLASEYVCADCSAFTDSSFVQYDNLGRKICIDCKIKETKKSLSQSSNKRNDFDLDFDWKTVVFIVVVIAVIKIVCKNFSKKHSSPRNSFRNNKVDKKSTNTINCNQNTAENIVNKKSFVFLCPHCNCKLESDTEWTGMECECPQCQKKIVIPQNSTNLQQKTKGMLKSIKGDGYTFFTLLKQFV